MGDSKSNQDPPLTLSNSLVSMDFSSLEERVLAMYSSRQIASSLSSQMDSLILPNPLENSWTHGTVTGRIARSPGDMLKATLEEKRRTVGIAEDTT